MEAHRAQHRMHAVAEGRGHAQIAGRKRRAHLVGRGQRKGAAQERIRAIPVRRHEVGAKGGVLERAALSRDPGAIDRVAHRREVDRERRHRRLFAPQTLAQPQQAGVERGLLRRGRIAGAGDRHTDRRERSPRRVREPNGEGARALHLPLCGHHRDPSRQGRTEAGGDRHAGEGVGRHQARWIDGDLARLEILARAREVGHERLRARRKAQQASQASLQETAHRRGDGHGVERGADREELDREDEPGPVASQRASHLRLTRGAPGGY